MQPNSAVLIYPHHLYQNLPTLLAEMPVYIIEDPLFFNQYQFHRQKLLFHRASMKYYQEYLIKRKHKVTYLESHQLHKTEEIGSILSKEGIKNVYIFDFDDNWLQKKVVHSLNRYTIAYNLLESPGFLTPLQVSKDFFKNKKTYRFAEFYSFQRQTLQILMDDDGPIGGKWNFDAENRKRLEKNHVPPELKTVPSDSYTNEALQYVEKYFPKAVGVKNVPLYPHTHIAASEWLDTFLSERLLLFGDYEDAISTQQRHIYHSLLTPMLNCGLITPKEIVIKTQACKNIPLNSLEGFIRQSILYF